MTPDDRNQLAAEYALGLLEGDDLRLARRLALQDADFRAEVGRWSGRLASLLDEVAPVLPPARVRAAIEARTAEPASGGATIHKLERRLTVWRGLAAGASALAASLAVVLLTQRPVIERVPVAAAPTAPLVANMAGDQGPARLVATWDPGDRSLVVVAAAGVEAVAGHSHELWVIPAGGSPRSLGVMPGNAPMYARLPVEMGQQLAAGATLAVSVEPSGGSPTGQPTGPVIAAGPLTRA